MQTFKMWDKTPGLCLEEPVLEYFPAENKITGATVVIYPGGGYGMRAEHEGKGYAEYFNSIGMDAFVCEYRVSPHRFPLELLDARRAVRSAGMGSRAPGRQGESTWTARTRSSRCRTKSCRGC